MLDKDFLDSFPEAHHIWMYQSYVGGTSCSFSRHVMWPVVEDIRKETVHEKRFRDKHVEKNFFLDLVVFVRDHPAITDDIDVIGRNIKVHCQLLFEVQQFW